MATQTDIQRLIDNEDKARHRMARLKSGILVCLVKNKLLRC